MLLSAAFEGGVPRLDGGGGGETVLEGDATFGSGDMFACSFGAVVDLVGWVEGQVVAGSVAGIHFVG